MRNKGRGETESDAARQDALKIIADLEEIHAILDAIINKLESSKEKDSVSLQ